MKERILQFSWMYPPNHALSSPYSQDSVKILFERRERDEVVCLPTYTTNGELCGKLVSDVSTFPNLNFVKGV
jgi:hypothetical protein